MTGQAFKTFPEFSKLTLADKAAYEALIKDFPPIADISFASLMTWWNQLDGPSVAMLNGNLVVAYWIPGDEKNAGLSLMGTNRVDESICTIFDYLQERGEPVRLVNVPEFVVGEIRYHGLFSPEEQRRHHEYIMPVAKYYPLKNIAAHRQHRIERHLRQIGEENIAVRSLDLRATDNKQLLLEGAFKWWHKNLNNFGKVEREAMTKTVLHANKLDIDNVCLFIDGELRGFCLYQLTQDRRYANVCHVKALHRALLDFDLIAYQFAKWFADRGVMYVNLNSDGGILPLRMFMLTLGPCNFFRKYKIEPAGNPR